MIEIRPRQIEQAVVQVPGSKSYTHRYLIAAALSDGRCTLYNVLRSEDTLLTLDALSRMGIPIEKGEQAVAVQGREGELLPVADPIHLGNSGTSIRLLTAVAALGRGRTVLTGSPRLQQRPIGDLLDGLRQAGVFARSLHDNGCPPVEIHGGKIEGGSVDLRCRVSSQFLSALLLIAPCTQKGLDIRVVEGPVSRPYVDMTVHVMEKFGISVRREGYSRFEVGGGQGYRFSDFTVEPDASQAGYFWAAAAVTGGCVTVRGITGTSRQGDARFAEVLRHMGCRMMAEADGITICGGPLRGIEVDMADMPDVVPTLAVVASFAEGTTRITGVGHLKAKESDRLGAVVTELSKMGIDAFCNDSGMEIRGGSPKGARIYTYDDHRVAMSFAVAGLRVPGVLIENETCVEKSFPDFWKVFGGMKEEG